MQNAKCKIDEAFCWCKANYMVIFMSKHPQNIAHYRIIISMQDTPPRLPFFNFAFCILHFISARHPPI